MTRIIGYRPVLLATLLTAILSSQNVDAKNYYVRKTGNDKNLGTNRNQAFRTIGKAALEAGAGDVIFVGAGTYDENVIINGASGGNGNGNGWLILFADQNGAYTGDKGQVVLRPPDKTWAVRVYNSRNVLFYGLSIAARPGKESVSYGALSTNTSGYTYYYKCSFNGLAYALRDIGEHLLYVNDCSFQGGRYGLYATRTTATYVVNSQFAATQYGCVSYDGNLLSVNSTRFADRVDANSDPKDSRGIYALRTAMQVNNCEFERSIIGVYGRALKSADIRNCSFNESTSYAVRCDGESLSMSDSTVSKCNYGITLGDTSGSSSKLAGLQIEETRVGVMAYQGDYDFDDVTLRNNTYAIYQRTGNKRLTLTKSDQIKFVDNRYAILTNHAESEEAELHVSDQDFTGNDRGIVSYRTRVNIDRCAFGGPTLGAYLWQNKSITVDDCTFAGNPADAKACSYGLYARSGDINVSRCSLSQARYGVMIHNTSQTPPRLTEITSENNTVAALYIRDGAWTYSDVDKNSFRNSPRGVMAHSVAWTIDDVVTSDSCQYPIMDYYGDCIVRGVSTKGTTTGFYAYQSRSIDVDGLTADGFGSYGIRIQDCDRVKLANLQSRRNAHGAYIRSTKDLTPELADCKFSDNVGYGLLMSGATLDPMLASNLEFKRNRFGLRVYDRPLTLTAAMNIEIADNQYGVLCQREKLTLDQIELVGNAIGAYCYYGDLSIKGCDIASSSYGVIAYLDGDCDIQNSQFDDSAYGIYLRAMSKPSRPVNIAGATVNGATTCGIYLLGEPAGETSFEVRDSVIRNGRQGIVTQRSSLMASNVTLSDLSSIGINQASGSSTVRGCRFVRLPGSWSILARGDQCEISQTSIQSVRYGIGLLTKRGTVTNSTIGGSDYGLYLRGSGAKYSVMHTTVAGARYYGLVRYEGDSVVQNSIFDASYYGIYDGKRGGVFDHQSNLVFAKFRPYVNSVAGPGEINEAPYFVNAPAGDYHLTTGSPAINAGADLSAWVSVDLDGNSRPSFRGFEMGAYEFMEPGGSLRVLKWDEVAR